MNFEVELVDEGFGTDVTLERAFSCMGLYVVFEGFRSGESLRTNVAFMWSFSRMDAFVHL